ncbi:MAG: LolA family protein [Hyphomicrobiaceae bacterium]
MNLGELGTTIVRLLLAIVVVVASFGLLVENVGAQDKSVEKPASDGAASGWSAQVGDGTSGIALDERQVEMINKVSKYFSSLKSLRGRFRQTAADGKVMKGKFSLKQPGMFRFDYARPSRQVIVSDGKYLAIQDHDINTEDRVALDQTPFRVLLRTNVDLIRDAEINEVQETDKVLLLTITDKGSDGGGRIKLFFELQPEFELSEWVTTDAQGLDTRVEIGNLVKGETLASSKFKIEPMWGNNYSPN